MLELTQANLKDIQLQRDQAYNEIEELKTTATEKDMRINELVKSI